MAADLGTDTANSVKSIGNKIYDTLYRLMDKAYDNWRTAPMRKLQNLEWKREKEETKRKRLISKMEKRGDVSWGRMKRYAKATNQNICPSKIASISKEDMKEFARLAKRQGLVFSGVQIQDMNNNMTDVYHIVVTEKDIDKMKNIIGQINEQKKIEAIDKKLDEISARKPRTAQDLINIVTLQNMKEEMQNNYSAIVNEQTYEQTLEDIMKNPENRTPDNTFDRESNFDKVIDTYTDGKMIMDGECVIVDANDPERYIIAEGVMDSYKNMQYARTDYKVHNPDGNQKEFNDKFFDNRPKDYWAQTKKEMCDFGGFDKEAKLLRFSSVDQFKQWQKIVIEQTHNENIKKAEVQEYTQTIQDRTNNLSEKGFEMHDDGEVYAAEGTTITDKDGESIDISGKSAKEILSSDMVKDNKTACLDMAEAIVIGEEIHNYEDLIQNAEDMSMAKTNMIIAETEGEKAEAETELSKVQEKNNELVDKEDTLLGLRKAINACQAEEQRQNEQEQNKNQEQEKNNEQKQDNDRNDKEASHETGERDELRTMEEYEGEINRERNKDDVIHGNERNTDKTNERKQGAEKGTEKASKKPAHDRAD